MAEPKRTVADRPCAEANSGPNGCQEKRRNSDRGGQHWTGIISRATVKDTEYFLADVSYAVLINKI